MKPRPNIFRYATKELSQDAVICWLIAWADAEVASGPGDEELRQLGRRFLEALFDKWKDWPVNLGDEVSVDVCKQVQNIDVLVRVNGRYVLLIEDKTGTGVHDGQLDRYWHAVTAGETVFGELDPDDLYPIYFKTGNQALSTADDISRRHEYAVFERADFLAVLNVYDGDHSIVLDYRTYLQDLEDRTNSFVQWTPDNPRNDVLAWEGLYRKIEEDLARRRTPPTLGHVYHRLLGGFTGVWWRPSDVDPAAALWLEAKDGEAQLSVKLNVADARRRKALQRSWHEALLSAGGLRMAKPKRMRQGAIMAVAEWADEVLAFDGEPARLDLPGTMRHLRSAERVLRQASRELAKTR